MDVRTEPSRTRWLSALALGCVLAVSGCAGDGTDEPADAQTAPAEDQAQEQEEPDEQPTADDEQATDEDEPQDQAADASGDCGVDAATVTEVIGADIEVALDDVNELANDGVSCIYKGDTEDVSIIAAVSVGTWDGSDERVQGVVDQTAEYFDEPVATPDLGDQAFLFDDDFGGTSLVVFVDGQQYSTGLSGAGWDGTPLETLEQREAIVTELFQQASA